MYTEVVDSGDYLAGDDLAEWDLLSDGEKAVFLERASLIVDGMHSYEGKKKDINQAGVFPREGGEVPLSVKVATVLIAVRLADGIDSDQGLTSETIGKVSWSYDTTKGGGVSGLVVKSLLMPFVARSRKLIIR